MWTRRQFLALLGLVLSRRLLLDGGAFTIPVTPPATPLTPFTVAGTNEGGWTWFIDPRAVYYNGTTYFGYNNLDGDVTARSWDHATNTTNTLVAGNRLYAAMEEDDHDNPSVLVRDSDKKLLYFYTRHSDAQLYMSVSSSAESIASFAARVDLDSQLGGTEYTYPCPFQLLSEASDPIWLFYRDPIDADTTALYYSKSTDGGSTWAAGTLLYSNSGRSSYWKMESNSLDRVDFAVSSGSPVYDADVSIGHFYYTGGSFYKTDGTGMGSPPFDFSDLTLVYDGSGANDTSWVWDVAMSGSNPRIVYSTYIGDDMDIVRYRYATWSGSAWSNQTVTSDGGTHIGGGPGSFYAGGVVLDHTDPDVVFASVVVSGQWEIHRFETADAGASWAETAVTSGSSAKNIRPVSVRNYATDLQLLWMHGTYTTYLNYTTDTYGAGV
jgi:hypothetical protein